MSTRYVWDKYNTKSVSKLSYPQSTLDVGSSNKYATLCNDYKIDGATILPVGDSYQIKEANYSGSGSTQSAKTSDYRYAIIYYAKIPGSNSYDKTVLSERTDTSYYWLIRRDSADTSKTTIFQGTERSWDISGFQYKNCMTSYIFSEPGKGDTLEGQSSSASNDAYPQDGESNGKWYVYKGSDNIDPISLTYNTTNAEPAKPITAIVEPRTATYEWDLLQSPLEQAGYYNAGPCVAFGNGKFVSIPKDYYQQHTGQAAYSNGGWNLTTIPTYSDHPTFGYNACVYGNGKFVAVGRTNAHSSDGVNWVEGGNYPTLISSLIDLAFGDGKFVGVEKVSPPRSKAALTTNGENWSEIDFGVSAQWVSIAYGNGKFVAVASDGTTAYGTPSGGWYAGSVPTTPKTIKFCNNKFFVLTADNTKQCYSSADGVNWTPANIPQYTWSSMAYGNGIYIVVSEYYNYSESKYAISTDGEDWSLHDSNINGTGANGIAYGDGKFVCFEAVGNNIAVYEKSGFGGTVSYLYQYSINGGSTWSTSGTATTDTEKEIVVPMNAEQFVARVQAQDNMGFVSNDYVVGINLIVQLLKLWIGIVNAARTGKKIWVGIDNKAKKITKGWVGVNNQAEKFF